MVMFPTNDKKYGNMWLVRAASNDHIQNIMVPSTLKATKFNIRHLPGFMIIGFPDVQMCLQLLHVVMITEND